MDIKKGTALIYKYKPTNHQTDYIVTKVDANRGFYTIRSLRTNALETRTIHQIEADFITKS